MLYSSIVCTHLSLQPHSSPLLRPSMLTYLLLSSIPAIFSNFHASVPLTASSSLYSLLFFFLFASPPSLISPYPFICHHPFRNSPPSHFLLVSHTPYLCLKIVSVSRSPVLLWVTSPLWWRWPCQREPWESPWRRHLARWCLQRGKGGKRGRGSKERE